jgi:hypothetical protein
VYVHGLAKFLQRQGHDVQVLAAVPEEALNDCELVYQDEFLRAGRYEHDGVTVTGCVNHPTGEETYSRFNPRWKTSWLHFFEKTWQGEPLDLLHMHANTALVSSAFIETCRSPARKGRCSVSTKKPATFHPIRQTVLPAC